MHAGNVWYPSKYEFEEGLVEEKKSKEELIKEKDNKVFEEKDFENTYILTDIDYVAYLEIISETFGPWIIAHHLKPLAPKVVHHLLALTKVLDDDNRPKALMLIQYSRRMNVKLTMKRFRQILGDSGIFYQIDKSDFLSEGRVMSNPLVQAVRSRDKSKTMSAYVLCVQSNDVPLEKLVQRLMLELGENDAWYKFLVNKGATGTEAAEKKIIQARTTKKPERVLIPDFLHGLSDYMALEWLEDLRTIPETANAAHAILLHLAQEESVAHTNAAKAARLYGEVHAFIVNNELTSDYSSPALEQLLENLKRFGVTSLADLRKMTEQQFSRCGFDGLYTTKAVEAAKKIPL